MASIRSVISDSVRQLCYGSVHFLLRGDQKDIRQFFARELCVEFLLVAWCSQEENVDPFGKQGV